RGDLPRRGRAPALGQDALPRRGDPRRALPAPHGLPGRARRSRPRGDLREHVHPPGARRVDREGGGSMTRAVVATGYGGAEVLEVVDLEVGEPGEGQVLVDVRAAAFNP